MPSQLFKALFFYELTQNNCVKLVKLVIFAKFNVELKRGGQIYG